MRAAIVPAVVMALVGCASEPAGESRGGASLPAAPPAGPEATSLLGEPLEPASLPEAFRAEQEALLDRARSELEDSPDDPEAWIWVGRRTAYLGRYREAIAIYGRALERFPEEARLYRHRGHRHLTTRKIEAAIDDLVRGVLLTRGQPDRVEPDGLPNERGIPTSTLQSNIWYHLGLAHYLQGDFEAALAAYRECLAVSKNPDTLVATTYWLYLTLARLGSSEEAARALEPITPELDVIENHDYHRLLLSYRRLLDAPEMWSEASRDRSSIGYATIGYGLGAYHLIAGRDEKATQWFDRVLDSAAWPAFGYLAAEAERARSR